MNEKLLPLFTSARLQEQAFSHSLLQSYLQNAQKEYLTGLLEIAPSLDQRFAIIFVRGLVTNVYRRNPETISISKKDWLQYVPASHGVFIARSLALSPQTVRMVKIYIEQLGNGQAQSLPTKDLEVNVQYWGQSEYPLLVKFSWPDAQALALLPGAGQPSRHTLFISGEQVLHSAGGMSALYHWKESICQTIRYSGEHPTSAWTEYILHRAFVQFVGHLLRRIDELTDKVTINTIVREINFSASAHSWNINLTPISVTDQAVFSNPEETALVYKQLFEILQQKITSLLGSDLLNMLNNEALLRIPQPYRQTLELYLFHQESNQNLPTLPAQAETPK